MMILIVGNPVDGCAFYGPFIGPEEAEAWAEDNATDENWWVAELNPQGSE